MGLSKSVLQVSIIKFLDEIVCLAGGCLPCRGCLPREGVCSGRVSAWRGCLPGKGFLPRGCLPRGGSAWQGGVTTHL